MLEPYISVTNVDQTIGLSADPVDNRLNILCPVISPAGPLELTRVSGPSEFRRLFFGGRAITANDEISAIFARSLVSHAPIWIKRAARNTMRGGVSSATGSPVYVDEDLLPISGSKITFLAPDIETVSEGIAAWIETSPASLVVDGKLMYTSGSAPEGNWVKTSTSKKISTILKFDGEATVSSVMVTVGDLRVSLPAGQSNLDYLLKILVDNGNAPQTFTGTGSIVEEGEEQQYPSNVTQIGWVAPIGISIVSNNSQDEGKFITESGTGSVTCITAKTEEENINSFQLTSPKVEFTSGATQYAYYCGSYSGSATVKTQILSTSTPTYSEFMSALVHSLATDFHAATASPDSIILPDVTDLTASGIDTSIEQLNQVVDSERFAVISKFPCDTPQISMTITRNSEYYTITANYQDDIKEEWNFGFDASAVDGYGNSLYYTRVNDESQLIYIAELNGEMDSNGLTVRFGNEVTSDYSDVTDVISTLESIPENEEASSFFDFITDGGIVDTTLSSVIQNLSATYHSFYPASVPQSFTESDARSRRQSLGENYQSIFIAEQQRSSTVDSGSVMLPASYYYLVRRIELGNTSQEFINLFGPTLGYLGMNSPAKKWSKSQREDFLDNQINTLKRDPSNGYYLNRSLTCYSTDSYLQSDGIVLMVNKIGQVADSYGKTLLGKNHTRDLEVEVTNELNQTLRNRLRVGTPYGPVSLETVCDSSNNTVAMMDRGDIRIDIYATFARSITRVLVYTNILPLSE